MESAVDKISFVGVENGRTARQTKQLTRQTKKTNLTRSVLLATRMDARPDKLPLLSRRASRYSA